MWPHDEGALGKRLWLALAALASAATHLFSGRVQILHCHASMRGSFWRKSLFALLGIISRTPVVFHLHGSEFKVFHASQSTVSKRLIRLVLESVDCVIVLSSSWANFVNEIAPKAKVEVLPNFVTLPPEPTPPRARDHDVVNALFLGAVGIRKGIFDLLPAVQLALQDAPNLKITIGGDGDLAAAKAMADQLGISSCVHFAGWVSGSDKVRLLQDAHFYVLPSHNEGLPMSLLEAMSYRLPVISTRVGGIPELIDDDKDGFLIDAGDVKALARSLSSLALDAPRREAMGHAAYEKIVKRYADTAVIPKLESIYRRLLRR